MEESVRFKPTVGGSFNPLSMYPVGSIYRSVLPTDPSELFGGTWELLKDVFLMAAGDKYAAGSTGGEAQHKLTVDEMPAHNHSYEQYLVANDGGYGSWVYDNQFYIAVRRSVGSTQSVGTDPAGKTSGSVCHEANLMHRMSVAGGSQPHNNLPPYLAVYTWVRTA